MCFYRAGISQVATVAEQFHLLETFIYFIRINAVQVLKMIKTSKGYICTNEENFILKNVSLKLPQEKLVIYSQTEFGSTTR